MGLSRTISRLPIDQNCEVGPHEFRPLRRLLNRGRCAACYCHEDLHPVAVYTAARPLLDRRLPVVGTKGAL